MSREGLAAPRRLLLPVAAHASLEQHERAGACLPELVAAFAPRMFEGNVDTIAGGMQGRFSLLPSDSAGENFVKVVQRVPVKIRLAATDAVLLPGLSAGVTVKVR